MDKERAAANHERKLGKRQGEGGGGRRHMSFFCFFVKNACTKKPCSSNDICQAGFSSEGYRCVSVPVYTSEDCTEGEADKCRSDGATSFIKFKIKK